MESTLATVMYYLLHILAVFGLIFLLILLVRVTMWCLMCNLEEKKKSRQNRLKLKSLKKAEEGRIGGPPTLRRSPNVQRLNLIKPEDDKKFSETLKSQKSEPSSSSSSEIPPTPPPKDIEAQEESVQQGAAPENAVYATLAFSGSTKRKAPSPPQKRVSCICPYCSSLSKAMPNAEPESDEPNGEEEAEEQEQQEDSEVVSSQETATVTEEIADTLEVVVDVVPNPDVATITLEEAPTTGAENDLPPLPQTPEAQASSSSSSESLHTQNALDSLDQAIEELDGAMNDLAEVANDDSEANPTESNEEPQSEPDPESAVSSNENTTVVTVEINAIIEPDSSMPISNGENDEPQVNGSIEEGEQQTEEVNVEQSENETTEKVPPENTAEPADQTPEPESSTEKVINDNIDSDPPPTNTLASQVVLRKTAIQSPAPKVENEEVVAFIPPKPSEIRKRESLKRKSMAPRIIESVSKPGKPAPHYKPIKLSRAVSSPANGTATANGEPQCAIYARVIDQIKQRVQESVSPELQKKNINEQQETVETWETGDTEDAAAKETTAELAQEST